MEGESSQLLQGTKTKKVKLDEHQKPDFIYTSKDGVMCLDEDKEWCEESNGGSNDNEKFDSDLKPFVYNMLEVGDISPPKWLTKRDQNRIFSKFSKIPEEFEPKTMMIKYSILLDKYYSDNYRNDDDAKRGIIEGLMEKLYRRTQPVKGEIQVCTKYILTHEFYSKMTINRGARFVRTDELIRHVDLDRERELRDDSMNNSDVSDLVRSMEKHRYTGPALPLAVNTETGRAYLQDGNHRAAALRRLGIKWVPVTLDYKNVYKFDGNELFTHQFHHF